jgi:phage gp36-like protein
MPTYIDRAGLEQRFGKAEIDELADDDKSGTVEAGEENSVTSACEDASTLIDGYLAAKYTLPLVSVPDMLIGWAADIARFRLWDDQAPEEVRRRYEDAIAQLRDLARGLIALPPGTDGTPASAPLAFDGYANERVFTETTLKDL